MSLSETFEKLIQRVSLAIRKSLGVFFLFLCGLFCLIGLFSLFDDESDPAGMVICVGLMALLFGFTGYRLWAKAPDAIKKLKDADRYFSLIVNQGHRDIETIAAIIGLDPKQVQREVQSLLDQNQLIGWQLNPRTGQIRKLEMNERGGHTSYMINKAKFECTGCGAQNNVEVSVGKVPECEFCRQPYTGELSD